MSAAFFYNLGILSFVISTAAIWSLWRNEKKRTTELEALHSETLDYWRDSRLKNTAEIEKIKKLLAETEAKLVPPPFSAIPIDPGWEASDILNLRKFLSTETGAKMWKRARALEYANAVAGAKDQFHTTHSAGRTAGISDILNWLESCASDEMFQKLSQASGDTDANTNTADGEGVPVSAEFLTP